MYSSDSYPLDWTKSNVLFIKKSYGKNVRPISLTSCVCKLFETILKNKFQWWLEFNNLLPPNQSGFQKGQSTTDNLA